MRSGFFVLIFKCELDAGVDFPYSLRAGLVERLRVLSCSVTHRVLGTESACSVVHWELLYPRQ